MPVHELAAKPAPRSMLVNIPALVSAYYLLTPDPHNPAQTVSFGTSGHRGSSFSASFNQNHIWAITQAVCEYRKNAGINGPLFIGMDTHALSWPALASALEVLAANEVEVMLQPEGGYTPTPVISRAIIAHNREKSDRLADGIVVTPSHNPPDSGGFKYNPPHGGPAGTEITRAIEQRANQLLARLSDIKRLPYERALKSDRTHYYDYIKPYVSALSGIVDMAAIKNSGVRLGVDPLGGASIAFWQPIAEQYGLELELVEAVIDPAFGFMTVDHDGKIRMDCSSPFAMARLIALKDRFDLAFGNDPDSDRHGIVTHSGLMNPNHYLSVAIDYLYRRRSNWRKDAGVGKTLVSSAMIDKVSENLGRVLVEVPVGFKWFVEGLSTGAIGFGGEESAGASFLMRDGQTWTTDKDGIIMDLLAAEIMAVTGLDPSEHYKKLTDLFGSPIYQRRDTPVNARRKKALSELSGEHVKTKSLAGEPVEAVFTRAPGNNQPIGGVKVTARSGWFAARPSGTEDIYKIYAESFKDQAHLERIMEEAEQVVEMAFREAGV